MYNSTKLEGLQILSFNYFLLLKANRFINKIIQVISHELLFVMLKYKIFAS